MDMKTERKSRYYNIMRSNDCLLSFKGIINSRWRGMKTIIIRSARVDVERPYTLIYVSV